MAQLIKKLSNTKSELKKYIAHEKEHVSVNMLINPRPRIYNLVPRLEALNQVLKLLLIISTYSVNICISFERFSFQPD